MKVHIHPHYAAYESYIRAIPSEEYEREEVYCNRRNTVERVRFGDKDFVIKKYKTVSFTLGFAKAKRSAPLNMQNFFCNGE